jgi:hypothetical protein
MLPNPRPVVRRPEDIIADQKRQAAAAKVPAPFVTLAQATEKAVATVPAKSTAVALPDNRTSVQAYVDDIAPAGIAGRLVKFGKEGVFATSDDGAPVSEEAEFIALLDQTLIGWIKFNEEGTAPDRIQGLLYDNFTMPARDTLGDTDESAWGSGLSGRPEDPWKHQVCVVLQNTQTQELFTFGTMSATGRRSVGNLLRHYDRMRRTNPNDLPVVRLKAGGFNHRDERIGWVATPVFVVVGRAPRDSVAVPDTSVAADMNDAIPF